MCAIYFAKFACEQRPPGSGHYTRVARRLKLQKHERLSEISYECGCQIDLADCQSESTQSGERRILAFWRARFVDTLAAVLNNRA